MRVLDIAKKLNLSVKRVRAELQNRNVSTDSHLTELDEATARQVLKELKPLAKDRELRVSDIAKKQQLSLDEVMQKLAQKGVKVAAANDRVPLSVIKKIFPPPAKNGAPRQNNKNNRPEQKDTPAEKGLTIPEIAQRLDVSMVSVKEELRLRGIEFESLFDEIELKKAERLIADLSAARRRIKLKK